MTTILKKKKLNRIKEIAKCVRSAFEEIEKEEDVIQRNLGGYCVRASIQLYLACRREGIRISMIEGIGHMYNRYNGKIVDITATQFRKCPKVLIHQYSGETPEYHNCLKKYKSVKSVVNLWWAPTYEQVKNDKEVVLKYLKRLNNG